MPQLRTAIRHSLPLLAAAALVTACQAKPVATLAVTGSSQQADGPVAMTGEQGTAQMRVVLADDKALTALGHRHVQSVDLSRATKIDVYATGAGINGWAGVKTGVAFGAADASGNRTATFSGSVQAGLRRIFRVVISDGAGVQLEELWGVADIPANATTTVTISRGTTCTGKIFRKLVLAGDTAKALQLKVADVQSLVDKLLNTDGVTGAALDGTKPQINYTLLNTDLAASAIAMGENGVTYTVPATLPGFLTPTPVKEAQVEVKAIDVLGKTITTAGVGFLTDQASPVMRTADATPLDMTFPHVTPGSWKATVVDTATGRTATVGVGVADGDSKVVSVMLPPQSIDRVIGAYNLETNATTGYNGEFMPPLLASLNSPQNLIAQNGVLTWADVGNQRIRQVDLNSNAPIVKTIAGNGTTATAAAADGSNATQVPIKITNDCAFTYDANGNLLFGEGGFNRIVKIDKATGQLTQVLATSQLTGYDTSKGLGYLQYVPATNTLYVGGNASLYEWQPIEEVNMATFPAAGSSKLLTGASEGTFVVAGNYLFYTNGLYESYLKRRDLTTGTEVNITGKNKLYQNADGVPAQDSYINSNWGTGTFDMAIDAQGNLFFIPGTGGIYRITDVLNGADGANNWVINNLAVANGAANGDGLTLDSVTGKLYFSGTAPVADPNGSGTQNVAAINLLRP